MACCADASVTQMAEDSASSQISQELMAVVLGHLASQKCDQTMTTLMREGRALGLFPTRTDIFGNARLAYIH